MSVSAPILPLVAAFLACAAEDPPPLPDVVVAEGVSLVTAGGESATATRAELRGERVVADVVTVTAGLDVRSRRSDWDLKAGTALFTQDVVAVRGEVTLRCERLEVVLGSAGTIKSASASGKLRLSTGGREATAERAELDVTSGTLVLTGSPRISEAGRSLSGDRIRVELDGGRAVCEGDPCRLTVDDGGLPAGGAP